MVLPHTYFNPRPPWGGRQHHRQRVLLIRVISIHALRGEGDQERAVHQTTPTTISIHALRGEGDEIVRSFGYTAARHFNPRPP